MKTFIVVASLLATSLAHAEAPAEAPSTSASADVAPTETSKYLSGGALLGADHAIVAAVSVDGGYQLSGSLWLHGMIAKGTAGGIDEPNYKGGYDTGRLGLEERGCVVDAVCAFAGLDVGYRHVDYMAEYDNTNTSGVVVVPRLGLDVGGSHLRFRPGIEGVLDGSQNNIGIDLTAAVAYRW